MLYKYLDPEGILALRTMTLIASDPTTFNDPFEVRPGFDQERHDYFAKRYESFHEGALGVGNSLLGTRSMVGIPTENAIGFGEHINERFRRELSDKYRVLCLSRDAGSVLMWGHYTRRSQLAYSGLVLGLDPSVPGFPTGIRPDGFRVEYPSDGKRVVLPLTYYQEPCVELYDSMTRRITNNPDQLVQSGGGLLIPFSEYRRQIDAASLAILTSKNPDWAYEQETRFIYRLPDHGAQLRVEKGRHLLPIPAAALVEVILGFRSTPDLVEEVVRLFQEGRIGMPKLFRSGCHPYQYEVQKYETDPDDLLAYYRDLGILR